MMKSSTFLIAAGLFVCGFPSSTRAADLEAIRTHVYAYDECLLLAQREGQKIKAFSVLHPLSKTGDPVVNDRVDELRDQKRAIKREAEHERCI